jgi:hypothetical protein
MDHQNNESRKTSIAAYFAASVLAVASVGAIVFSENLNTERSPKAMDQSAVTLFKAQGYDMLKRKSYRAFKSEETLQANEGVYALKGIDDGKAYEGKLICGRTRLPDMVMPRLCHVAEIKPK